MSAPGSQDRSPEEDTRAAPKTSGWGSPFPWDWLPELSLDHVTLVVDDLQSSAAKLELLLGRGRSWDGRRAPLAPENVAFRLEFSYLELVTSAAIQSQEADWTDFFTGQKEGILSVAFRTRSLAETTLRVRASGLTVDEAVMVTQAERDTSVERTWLCAQVRRTPGGAVTCSMIENRSPPVMRVAPEMVGGPAAIDDIVAVSLETERPFEDRRIWRDQLGFKETPHGSGWKYDAGNAHITLMPLHRNQRSSMLWSGLTLTVRDPQRLRDRLARRGVETLRSTSRDGQGLRLSLRGTEFRVVRAASVKR